MFGDRIQRSRRPPAVSMAAQIDGINMEVLAQGARHPVPIACVVQPSVNQHQCGFPLLPPVPKLQLQAMRIVKMRDRFQATMLHKPRSPLTATPWDMLQLVLSETSPPTELAIPFAR